VLLGGGGGGAGGGGAWVVGMINEVRNCGGGGAWGTTCAVPVGRGTA
jgi:hypothetical protein